MNPLLPAPKSIVQTGHAFLPHQWLSIQFPQEVEMAIADICQVMEEKWNLRLIQQNIAFDEKGFGQGFWVWLGEQDKPDLIDLSEARRKIIDKPQSYLLHIQECGAYAWSGSLAGLHHAMQTLRQILQGKELIELKIEDWPDLEWRGVHVDAKGEHPESAKWGKTLREWSRFKLNMVLFEYEDTFPYSQRPEITGSHAYTRGEIQQIQDQARDHLITIVPLVQTVGHAEYILRNSRYAFLRENGEIAQFCSSRSEVFCLLSDLLREVAEAHPDSPWIHIGGDEAWYLGLCPDCSKKVQQDGAGRLYIEHINRVAQIVKQTGKLPILWDDVLRRLENREDIKRLDRSCIIHYWNYQNGGTPLDEDWIQYLQSLGFQVMGGSAMRGASGMDSSCPKFQQRFRNSRDWGQAAVRFSLPGVIATSWGRYGSLKPLIEPSDLGWHGALAAAEHFWNAQGMERDEFDQRFAIAFLGEAAADFPEWLNRFEEGLPYQQDWMKGREVLSVDPQGHFIAMLDAIWEWRSEEDTISRKIELLEARLYRVAEEGFPDWERWRLTDRAMEAEEHLQSMAGKLHRSLAGICGLQWADEYIQSFTHKYGFRIKNLINAIAPSTPRQAEALEKMGTDYG